MSFILKFTSAPSLLPIQFFCCAFILSRKSKSSRSSINLCAYSVIFSIHCDFSFCTTGLPHLSQTPFTTSSFASPTLHPVQKFIGIVALYASPFLNNCINIHCVHL